MGIEFKNLVMKKLIEVKDLLDFLIIMFNNLVFLLDGKEFGCNFFDIWK